MEMLQLFAKERIMLFGCVENKELKQFTLFCIFFLLQEDAKQHIENYCLLLADAYYFIIKVN